MILSVTFTFGNFITILLGMVLGASWAATLYLKQRRNKVLTHINPEYNLIPQEIRNKYELCIEKVYTYHVKARHNKIKVLFGLLEIKLKVDYVGLAKTYLNLDNVDDTKPLSLMEEFKWLITTIAKDNYPDSEYPLFELTIDEIFDLVYKSVDLISNVINDLGIPGLNGISVKTVYDVSKLSGKILEIFKKKWIKILLKLYNAGMRISNLLNPAYWIKKASKMASNDSLLNYVFHMLFEIAGKLTATIYMKNKQLPFNDQIDE